VCSGKVAVRTILRCASTFFATVCIVLTPVSPFVFGESVLALSSPPISGDWIVTGTESHYDEVIVLNGNLIVENSGNLTFRKVTLKMNCAFDGQYSISINGGKFYGLEGSVITSANPGRRIGAFDIQHGSTFRMNNSELHECGWAGLPKKSAGLSIRSNDAVVENSLISHNWVGIVVDSHGAIVRNNEVTANDAEPESGIAVYGNSTIHNNHVSNNNGSGILVSGRCSPTICNNTVTRNWIGICIGDYATPIIQGNTVIENGESPLHLWGEGILGQGYCSPIIRNNNISSNKRGILLIDHCRGTIQGNIISSNGDFGIVCQNNSLPEIHWNDIYDNKNDRGQPCGVVNDDRSVTVNATYNYWGDRPSAHYEVLYNPWLTESIFPFPLAILSPVNGLTVGLTTIIEVVSTDLEGISKIEYYLQSSLIRTFYEMPSENRWELDTTRYPNGKYTITVKVYDDLGNVKSCQTQITIDNIEVAWWQTHFWSIIQVLIGVGSLILGAIAYLTRKGRKKEE